MEEKLKDHARFELMIAGVTYQLPKYCPHRGGYLACGYVNDKSGRITCPLHGATFEVRTGKRVAGPMCSDLAVKIVRSPERPSRSRVV